MEFVTLRRLTKTTLPSRIVTIQTVSEQGATTKTVSTPHRLVGWVGHYSERRGDQWQPRWTERGCDGHSAWRWISSLSRTRSTMSVYGYSVDYQLALLSLWENIISTATAGTASTAAHGPPISYRAPKQRARRGLIVIGNPPTILRLWIAGTPTTILDLRNYLDQPLSDYAESVGVDLIDYPPDRWCDRRKMDWAERASNVISDVVVGWLDQWGAEQLGPWRPTGSGLAMANWRTCHQPYDIIIERNEVADGMAKHASYGAHCRAFYRGQIQSASDPSPGCRMESERSAYAKPTGPVVVLDVRGMYPYVMRKRSYPVKLDGVYGSVSMATLRAKVKAFRCVAKVRVNTLHYPFPWRDDDGYGWAVGDFTSVLAGGELARAVDAGHVTACYSLCVYRSDWLFDGYVDYWWKQRRSAERNTQRGQSRLAKLMLDSLWGRFGMMSPRWQDTTEPARYGPWGRWYAINAQTQQVETYRTLAGIVQKSCPPALARYSMPSISACVLADSRVYMQWLYDSLPAGSLLYSDTDSLHVTIVGAVEAANRGWLRPYELGGLRIEMVSDAACYYGPKDYQLDDKTVIPGLQPDATLMPSGIYEQERWQTTAELTSRDQPGVVCRRKSPFTARRRVTRWADVTPGWLRPPHRHD